MTGATGCADLYLSPLGNDKWSGTLPEPDSRGKDGPLRTLRAARDRLRKRRRSGNVSPATVLLRGGRYEMAEAVAFEPCDGLTTWAAWPGEEPVLDGGVRIDRWRVIELHGRAAWVADVSDWLKDGGAIRSLFVNDMRRPRTRLPKEGFHWIEEAPFVQLDEDLEKGLLSGCDRFRVRPGDIQPWKNLTDVEVVAYHWWTDERMPIVSYDAETGWVQCSRRSIFQLRDDIDRRCARYVVENVFESADGTGGVVLRPLRRGALLPAAARRGAGNRCGHRGSGAATDSR